MMFTFFENRQSTRITAYRCEEDDGKTALSILEQAINTGGRVNPKKYIAVKSRVFRILV